MTRQLQYAVSFDEPADTAMILENTQGIIALQKIMPNLNGRFTTFMKALFLCLDKGWVASKATEIAEKKKTGGRGSC